MFYPRKLADKDLGKEKKYDIQVDIFSIVRSVNCWLQSRMIRHFHKCWLPQPN